MDIYTTSPHNCAAGRCEWGVSVFMGMEFLSIPMDHFLSNADSECSLSIDPRRT
ncbi:hypothetical protein [Acidovorax sp. FHTAMBA]|uniref:hypothetical protein n=1 Tax=Acidovorax sp. FHTAMBA TaxID=3140252 RepID=UPI00135F1986